MPTILHDHNADEQAAEQTSREISRKRRHGAARGLLVGDHHEVEQSRSSQHHVGRVSALARGRATEVG